MTDYDPVLTDAPDVLPVSLDECKQQLRVTGSDEDGLIAIYLNAAVGHLDGDAGWLGRAIVAQTWAQNFDRFASSLFLGLEPVSSITSVKYYDTNGALQTVASANYVLINAANSPELRFVDDFAVPAVRDDLPTVLVTFVSGYGDDSAAPAPIKAAILLMVSDLYQNREAKVDGGMMDNPTLRLLLDPYRRTWVA